MSTTRIGNQSLPFAPIKGPSQAAAAPSQVSPATTVSPSPPKTGPSSESTSHASSMETQRTLTSPETLSQIGSDAQSKPPSEMQATSQQVSDLGQSIGVSAPSAAPSAASPPSAAQADPQISPRHMKMIEDLAREGKSPDEIARHLMNDEKNPGDTGAARYTSADSPNKMSASQLAEKIKATPQFARGESMSRFSKMDTEIGQLKDKIKTASLADKPALEQQLKAKETEKRNAQNAVVGPNVRASERIPLEIARYKEQLKNPSLSDEKRAEIQGKLDKALASQDRMMSLDGPLSPEERVQNRVENKRQLEIAQKQLAHMVATRPPEITRGLRQLPQLQDRLQGLEERAARPGNSSEQTAELNQQIGALRKQIAPLEKEQRHQAALETRVKQLKADSSSVLRSDMLHDDNNVFQRLYRGAVAAQAAHDDHGQHGEMQWNKIKREFLGTDRREFSMRAVIDFRQEFVLLNFREAVKEEKAKELAPMLAQLDELQKNPSGNAEAIGKLQKQIKTVTDSWDKIDKRAVGSTDLTSDFDMTVIADRAGMDTRVMANVNARFQKKYGTEAGNVFDTNLYVAGGGPMIKKEVKEGAKEWASKPAHAMHDEAQDVVALVKQRLYSSQADWDKFTGEVRTGLTAKLKKDHPDMPAEQLTALVDKQMSRFDQAAALHDERDKAIKAKVAELRKEPGNADKTDYDIEIIAMNRLFEAECFTADGIKAEWEQMPASTPDEKAAKDLKWAEYTKADAKAQLYANEPYFSEGPVRHVVGNEQALKGLKTVSDPDDKNRKKQVIQPELIDDKPQTLKMDTTQAMESVSENFGDAKKELMHLADKPMGEIAIKASKYMGRLTRAIDYALPRSEQSDAMRQTIANLQGAEVELLRVRKGGKIPESFVPKVPSNINEEYAVHVLETNGLGHIKTAADLEACFRGLKQEAEVSIRAKMATEAR